MSNEPFEAYKHGTVTVGTTATLIASPGKPGGIYLTNSSGAIVFLGGPGVTASGATAGPQMAVSSSITFPTSGPAHDLYGIVATGTSSVSYAHPA